MEGTVTLGQLYFTMIGRADIEGSKGNVSMNACTATQALLCLSVMGKVMQGRGGGVLGQTLV